MRVNLVGRSLAVAGAIGMLAGAGRLTGAPLAQAPAPAATTASAGGRYWPQWRGADATGVSRTATPPIEWSETRNVRWKKEIPGRGSSSPIVWGDRVFVMTAVPVGVPMAESHAARGGLPRVPHRFVVMAL